jgi:hypothetical protein
VFNANTVLAAVFGSVVMGASWALEGARHGNPAVALWILATMMPVGIGILSWKAIKLRDEIAYLTRGFIPGLPHHGVYARLKPSRVAPGGVGAFAIQSIPKGAPVFLGDDCRMSWVHRDLINGLNGSLWQLYDDFGIVKNKGELWGCPWNFNATTVAWYVNHSPSPNMFCKDYDFFAARDIEPGEELTVDYHTFNDFDQVPDYMRAGAVGTV